MRASPLYETQPWGGAAGGNFLNAVLEIERRGDPETFLRNLLAVERDLGRRRIARLAARTCDLDLLLWGENELHSETLTVPHPQLAARRFVLVPLCDLIPEMRHPLLDATFRNLLRQCPDPLDVRPFFA